MNYQFTGEYEFIVIGYIFPMFISKKIDKSNRKKFGEFLLPASGAKTDGGKAIGHEGFSINYKIGMKLKSNTFLQRQ